MEKRVIDYMLVPLGLFALVAYHVWLLYRVINYPTKTIIGINAIHRRSWARAMLENLHNNGVLAVQSLRNNIMSSTLMASMAIMLSSLIAVLMTSGGKNKIELFIFGDKSEASLSIKYFSIMASLLVAFLFNLQSISYYSYASVLVNVPYKKISQDDEHEKLIVDFVGRSVNTGSYFFSLGLRAFYISFALFLWIFGPLPMFVYSFVLVFMLYFLDVNFHCGAIVDVSDEDISVRRPIKDEELGIIIGRPI